MSHLTPVFSVDSFEQAYYIKEQLSREGITCFFSQKQVEDRSLISIEVEKQAVEPAVHVIVELVRTHGSVPEINKEATRSILLAVNLHSYVDSLLVYTLEMARKQQAEIKLLYVEKAGKEQAWSLSGDKKQKNDEPVSPEIHEKARDKLAEFNDEFRKIARRPEYQNIDYNYCLMFGNPAKKILEVAQETNPDLLLMGAKNTEANGNKVLGHVSLEVAQKTNVPMIAVPRKAYHPEGNELRILYATDFYKTDFEALKSLLNITSAFQVRVFYVHIDLNGDSIAKYTRKLSTLSNQLQQNFTENHIEPHLIANKDLFTGIQEFVDLYKVNLIAFTSPKKSLFDKLLKPNNLKKMLYQSNIPLFIFKG